MLNKKFLYGFLLAFLALSFIPAGMISSSSRESLEVVFFDVGQGDAILISQGSNQTLIDGGSNGKIIMEKLGEYVPFWDRNIELVIATHSDQDHIGGLINVLENYEIGRVIDNGVSSDSEVFKKFEKIIQEKNIKELEGNNSMKIKLSEGIELEIFHPDGKQNKNNPRDTNSSSIVSRLTFGDNSFLFTGDLPSKEESILVALMVDLKSKVLKVSHHGSKSATSQEFLDAVSSEDAIISVGKNSYGHPTAEILERLKEKGIRIIRTDEKGDIIYECEDIKSKCLMMVK